MAKKRKLTLCLLNLVPAQMYMFYIIATNIIPWDLNSETPWRAQNRWNGNIAGDRIRHQAIKSMIKPIWQYEETRGNKDRQVIGRRKDEIAVCLKTIKRKGRIKRINSWKHQAIKLNIVWAKLRLKKQGRTKGQYVLKKISSQKRVVSEMLAFYKGSNPIRSWWALKKMSHKANASRETGQQKRSICEKVEFLREQVEVRAKSQEISIQLEDIDEVMLKKDILTVLERQFRPLSA